MKFLSLPVLLLSFGAAAVAADEAAHLANVSTRAPVGDVAGTPIAGFVVSGTGSRQVLVRACGPSLANFGVVGALADPALALVSGNTTVASNDNWLATDTATIAAAGAFALPAGSRDAALVATVASGAFTLPVTGVGNSSGVTLLELYDTAGAATARIANASTRAFVGTGDAVLIPGFVISGTGTLRVLIRAVGPALASFGVSAPLADPTVTLYRGTSVLATNDNWSSAANATEVATAAAAVGAFALPAGSKDAALLTALPAGSYTAVVSGVGNSTGTALVELYALASATASLSFPIVDTAETKTFNATVETTAPAPGQPFYGQDAQFTGNPPNYTLSSDGKTVADNVTGLTWMRGPNTTLTPPVAADKKTFAQAQAWVATVNALNYGGFNDWRLPSIKELYSLMNFSGVDASSYQGTDTSVLTPFIDRRYFNFGYGQLSAGERLIDAQYASRDVSVHPAENGSPKLFGLNFADGRIKGYDTLQGGKPEMTFYVQLVRGATAYGANSFVANSDGTVTDNATGLMWTKTDNGTGITWEAALAWAQTKNAENYLGHSDWRLPNVKELQSLLNYANAPDFNGKPAIDTAFFTCTPIVNEAGDADFGYYWTSTTHPSYAPNGVAGTTASYVAFGRGLGWPDGAPGWIDIHGAGCQRSDPKVGPPFPQATPHTVTKNGKTYTGYAFGPQGDAIRGFNFVRLVRDAR